MKYIEIPAPVEVTNLEGTVIKNEKDEPVTVTFEQFLLGRLTDPKFASNMAQVLIAVEIKTKLSEAKKVGGLVLELENEHYKTLKEVVENPSKEVGYTPGLAHNLVAFMKAVVDAKDQKPPSVTLVDEKAEKAPANGQSEAAVAS